MMHHVKMLPDRVADFFLEEIIKKEREAND
jgi:hypothetical protein